MGEPDISEALVEDDKQAYGFDADIFPGVVELLEELAQTFDLAIITNGRSRGQNAKIDSVGIRKYFKVITVSEEEGIKKPHDPI